MKMLPCLLDKVEHVYLHCYEIQMKSFKFLKDKVNLRKLYLSDTSFNLLDFGQNLILVIAESSKSASEHMTKHMILSYGGAHKRNLS